VVSTLREAAAVALASAAADTAVACLRRALAEPPPASERAHLVLALASAELRAGDAAAAVEHFEEGLRLHPDPRTRAAWVWEQSVALQAVGRNGEAYAVRERAADEVAEHDPELALTVESSLIASASLDLSRLAWARERLDRRRGRLTGATAAEQRLLAMRAYLDALYGTAPAGELADVAERALASGDLVDEASRMVTTAWFAAIEVLWLADRTGPARRALDAAAEDARRRGAGLAFACISGWRCMLLARDGSLLDAEADARSCAEIALSQGGFALAPPMLGYVLSVLIDRGELDDAEQLLERTGMRDRAADDDLALYPMIHARGRVRAGRGDLTGARTDFAALTGRRARWCTEMTLVPALLAAPELGPERFSEADARGMIADAEAWGTARATGLALRAAGLVAGDVDVLERAAAVLERSPARLEHARALTDLGAAMRRSGSRAAAREPLRRALDIADTCGARPLADRTRQELRATGARPRRPRVSGVGALTASERRIVAMAADGLSNPEIAQALFVTKKTVESHLSGAYRKLGIRSRTQLAGALRDD
jgi:DNA-binding CsgD family transcriptional regulator